MKLVKISQIGSRKWNFDRLLGLKYSLEGQMRHADPIEIHLPFQNG